jgi:hypothetical protein
MLRMVSYPHRPQSGHIMRYLNRTYHVLPTLADTLLDKPDALGYRKLVLGTGFTELLAMSVTRFLRVPPESCFPFFTTSKRARSRQNRIPEEGRT